jgi:carbon-monoxide dehydrogenase medium subunit
LVAHEEESTHIAPTEDGGHGRRDGARVKPAPFEHHAPATVVEAVEMLAEFGDESKLLAGGQSLVPLLALRLARVEHLIDVNRIPGLAGIAREDGWLSVGALTRQSVAERSREVATAIPLLSRALPFVGHFQIRNRGTVGGSTAHADPASELPAVAVALDAELMAVGPGGPRTIPAAEFYLSTWTTALATDEVLTSVRYPIWPGRCGFAVEEFARRHGDFAIAGTVCGVQVAPDGRVERAAIALFGMGPTPVRARSAEAALVGSRASDADRREVAVAAVNDSDPVDDLHGPASYRKRVATYLTETALDQAIKEATGA